MGLTIGIRREDKNIWERRAPLVPADVADVARQFGVNFIVQPSPIRAFPEGDYANAGAAVQEDISPAGIVLGIKEIPLNLIQSGKVYIFFSHTIKGQAHNMPMLRRMLELKCTLIDYEKVVDEKGRRLIFFGRHAGFAGAVDTLWALGWRLAWEGITDNPFVTINNSYKYRDLVAAKADVSRVADAIRRNGLPQAVAPLVIGITGYGNVSGGAQEIVDILPCVDAAPEDLAKIVSTPGRPLNSVFKVVFKEQHTVEPVAPGGAFDLQDYIAHPEKYRGCFERHAGNLTVLLNCVYWDRKYPRLLTKGFVKGLYAGGARPRLRVIGDISCDIEGGIEVTLRATDPGNPVFVYDVGRGTAVDGVAGNGPVIMSVDNLPCELPVESSADFSAVLRRFVPAMAVADFTGDFEHCSLPREIRDAVLVYRGQFTPAYRHMEKFLS
jgi:saccharopine dehydrogenase (NAD+, L-lysine-forming)